MKKLALLIPIVLALILMVPTASASEISSYDSGFQVQNLSSSPAAIVITFFNSDGTQEAQVPDTIPANGSQTYYPLSGVSDGFSGSVVISSDQPIAAIANVLGDGDGSSYSGFDAGAGEAYIPLTYRNYFNIDSWFNVQNTGSTSTHVEVSYAGTTCTDDATIPPSAAWTFDQADTACLPDGFVGAATVSSTDGGTIVATALQVAPNGLFAYNGSSASSTNPVMPLTTSNWFNVDTGTQIQNTGGSSTDVTVTYTPAGGGPGTQCTETRTIAPGASETFTLYAFSVNQPTNSTCTFGQQFVGAMEVTGNSANQPLVAVVNQTDFTSNGSTYNGFDPSSGTATVVLPLIQDAYNIFTGFNVQNVGSSATVTCDFSDLDASYNVSATLGTGGVMNEVQLNAGWPANTSGGYVGSAVCTADNAGAQLLAVVNQNNQAATGDGWLTYEAVNQ